MVSASTITNWPNNRVNIPHRTELSYAVVHMEEEGGQRIMTRIEEAASQIAAETGLVVELEHRHFRDAFEFSPELRLKTLRSPTNSASKPANYRRSPPTTRFPCTTCARRRLSSCRAGMASHTAKRNGAPLSMRLRALMCYCDWRRRKPARIAFDLALNFHPASIGASTVSVTPFGAG